MKLSELLIVLSLASCATGNIPPVVKSTDSNSRLVSRVIEFVSPSYWRQSGYYRPQDDITTPVKLILAGDHTACPVFEIEVYPVRTGEFYICKLKWRIRRN